MSVSMQSTPGLSLQRVETMRAECNGCDSVIPRTNVVMELDPDTSHGVQRRSIKAYCEHCRVGYELIQELRGGEWIVASGVIMLDKRAKSKLIKKLAHAG